MKTLTKIEQAQIKKLESLVKRGLESLSEAGKIVASLLDQGYIYKDISSASGFLTIRDVADLERIGRGQMNPSLMVFTSPSVKYLRETPLEVQAEVIENGVEVLVEDNGKFVKKTLTIPQLSHRQCKLVFNGSKINSIAAQKKILTKTERKRAYQKEVWEIKKGELVISGGLPLQ